MFCALAKYACVFSESLNVSRVKIYPPKSPIIIMIIWKSWQQSRQVSVTYTYTKTANAGIDLRKRKHALTDKIKSHEDIALF
jgi:hypothetical protein